MNSEIHKEDFNKPSVYFDIDGTLGKWYADGRGYSSIEEIIAPANHYFRNIDPHPFMIELAHTLQNEGHDVCIISAADKDTIEDKMEWIHNNLPFISDKNVFFSPIGADKADFVKGNAEISVLIDDYNVNLNNWEGQAVKAINTVNSSQKKYPEIDMTIPETFMEQFRISMERLEQNVTTGLAPEQALSELKEEVITGVCNYLEELDPVVAVDKDGEVAVLPLFQTEDGKMLTAEEVEKDVVNLLPEEPKVEANGRTIDNDWYNTPETETQMVGIDIELSFSPSEFLAEEARLSIDAVKDEYQRSKDTELAYDIIESANFAVKENAVNKYDVIDTTNDSYRAIDCENLSEVIGSIDVIGDSLLDYMASELYHSEEYKALGNDSAVTIPLTTEEWQNFAKSPDFKEFVKAHKTEFEQIELLASPERLEKAYIDTVAHDFFPEDKAYYKHQLNDLMSEDHTLSMHGKTYQASEEAEAVLSAMSHSSYAVKLNDDNTFDLYDTKELRSMKEQETSELLATFINREGLELDATEILGCPAFVLYDTERGDYLKDNSGTIEPVMNAIDVMRNMGARIEEIQQTLEDNFEAKFDGSGKEMPSTPSEWTSFAGRRGNEDFVKDNKYELDVMRLSHDSHSADIHKAYEVQNERQGQVKEDLKKVTKKFDRTDN